VDLVYPAIEHTPFGDGDGMTDAELETLEGICLESADLLDKAVPEFANVIYDFLNGLSPHASFSDPLRAKWLKLKQEAADKVEARKYVRFQVYHSELHQAIPPPMLFGTSRTFSTLLLVRFSDITLQQ
jgi:hypothetical protein